MTETEPQHLPETRGPVPSDQLIKGLIAVAVLVALVGIGLIGARVFVLTENVRDLDKTTAAQDQALKEANRRLEQAGEPQVPVPDPGTEAPTVTDAALAAALEAYCGDCLGPRGSTGATGARGLTGQRGPRGVEGPASTVPGPTGKQGSDGKDGATGARGESCVEALGLDECRGPKGADGADGQDGADGADGAPGVVSVVDACNPPAGDVVTDMNIAYDQPSQTITITCTSEPPLLPKGGAHVR